MCRALIYKKTRLFDTLMCVIGPVTVLLLSVFVNPSIYCSKKLNYKLHFFVDSPFCIFLRQKKFLTFTTNYWVEKLL
jgi:hypothetical protein